MDISYEGGEVSEKEVYIKTLKCQTKDCFSLEHVEPTNEARCQWKANYQTTHSDKYWCYEDVKSGCKNSKSSKAKPSKFSLQSGGA